MGEYTKIDYEKRVKSTNRTNKHVYTRLDGENGNLTRFNAAKGVSCLPG
jgi:hypothetical protein